METLLAITSPSPSTLSGPKKAHQGLIKAAGKIFQAEDAIHLQPVVPKLRIGKKGGEVET